MPGISLRSPQSEASASPAAPTADPGQDAQDRLGNQFLGSQTEGASAPTRGPFLSDWLNGLLESCFGSSLAGLEAGFGEDGENEELGAIASTRGQRMSFTSGLSEDPSDLDAMEAFAHEAAHGLAGTDPKGHAVDREGDPGERSAERAGSSFRAWAASGFAGPAPSLRPAFGGRAELHRASDGPALTGSPLLSQGSSGELVRALQEMLNEQGAGLEVDGIFGPLTEQAVRNYQSAQGLSVDGIVGPQTADALNGGASSESSEESGGPEDLGGAILTGDPLLQVGSMGAEVETLQQLLNEHGASLAVDGDLGPLTESAVRSFQSANGLLVDGIVGPETAGALSSGSADSISSGGDEATPFDPSEYADYRDMVIGAAESHLGAPYYWGANGPDMFDCSGFVLYVLREDTGLISWGDDTAQGISNRLPSTGSPERGDCVFFSTSGSVGHVEICTGNGSETIGAGGGGSSTFGDDPDAEVMMDNWNNDGRAKSWGSIESLIEEALAASS